MVEANQSSSWVKRRTNRKLCSAAWVNSSNPPTVSIQSQRMSARHHRTWLSSARKTPSSRVYRTVPLARHSVGRLASMRERFGQDDLKCVRVAVQGIRNVGWHLAPSLSDAGPILLVSDIHNNRKRVTQRTFAATQVPRPIKFTILWPKYSCPPRSAPSSTTKPCHA